MIKGNTMVQYVSPNGKVHKVMARTDEASGRVSVKFSDGHIEEVKSVNVFNTQVAANTAAANRRTKVPGHQIEPPTIIRNKF